MGRLRSPPRPWIRRLASHLSPAPCRSSISAAFRPCGELCLVGLVHLGSGVRHRSVSALTVQVRSCSLSAYVFPTLCATCAGNASNRPLPFANHFMCISKIVLSYSSNG
jgi:hypothetical protein